MDEALARMRREYEERGLRKADLLADPLEQFTRWFDEACSAPILEPNAMTLATVDGAGQPAARTVLLKEIDRRGLTFYTNLESRKARELMVNAKAALLFWWPPHARQVRFEGTIEPRPPFWGGYRLVPERVEFWQGRINRLHDRLRYICRGAGWQIERLAP